MALPISTHLLRQWRAVSSLAPLAPAGSGGCSLVPYIYIYIYIYISISLVPYIYIYINDIDWYNATNDSSGGLTRDAAESVGEKRYCIV